MLAVMVAMPTLTAPGSSTRLHHMLRQPLTLAWADYILGLIGS